MVLCPHCYFRSVFRNALPVLWLVFKQAVWEQVLARFVQSQSVSLSGQACATSAQVSAIPVVHMDHSRVVFSLPHLASASVTAIPVTIFVQAVCHKWPRSFAVAACTRLALNYMDDVSLTEEVLLEPARVALRAEQGPTDHPSHQEGPQVGPGGTSRHQQEVQGGPAVTPSHQQGTQGGPRGNPPHQQGVHGGIPQVHASALPLNMSERQLGLPRPEPCSQGLCVQTRWGLLFIHTHLQRRHSRDIHGYNDAEDLLTIIVSTTRAKICGGYIVPALKTPHINRATDAAIHGGPVAAGARQSCQS